jgi:hypothetical protein
MVDVSVAVALKVTWSAAVGFAGEWLTLTVGGVVSVTCFPSRQATTVTISDWHEVPETNHSFNLVAGVVALTQLPAASTQQSVPLATGAVHMPPEQPVTSLQEPLVL